MTKQEVQAIVDECRFPGYTFIVTESEQDRFVRAHYDEADTETGVITLQSTRGWLISDYATRSEIVATCFKCIITSHEHRVREWFTYQNKPIYQPHHDVDKLLSITEARAQ